MSNKTILTRIKSKKANVTSTEVLTNNLVKTYLIRQSNALSQKYNYTPMNESNLTLAKKDEAGELSAATNGKSTIINVENCFCENKPLEKQFEIVTGLFAHEEAHRLFTFIGMGKSIEVMVNSSYFVHLSSLPPKYESSRNEVEEFMKKKNYSSLFTKVIFDINNILEDARIENIFKISAPTPILVSCLDVLRSITKEEGKQNFKDFLKFNDAGEELASTLNYILRYVRFGHVNDFYSVGDCPFKERIEELAPYAQQVANSLTLKNNIENSSIIFIMLWDLLKKMLPQYSQSDGNEEDVDSQSQSDSNEQDGDSQSQSGSNEQDGDSQSKKGSPDLTSEELDAIKDTLKKLLEEGIEGSTLCEKTLGTDKANKELDVSQKGGGEPLIDYNSNPEFLDGEITTERTAIPMVKSLIGSILTHIAEEEIEKELDEEKTQMLKDYINKIPFDAIHGGCNIRINAISTEDWHLDMLREYEKNLNPSAKAVQKRIEPFFKIEESDLLQNQYYGKRLNVNKIHKQNYKYFDKRKRVNSEVSIAIGLIIDESGSMLGEEINMARSAAYVIAKSCEGLDVPTSIIGHSALNRNVIINVYSDFEDKSSKPMLQKLMHVDSRNAKNRDGIALKYMSNRLLETTSEKKLLLIISDGLPNDNGYQGVSAEKDMQNILREFSKKGGLYVAAGIGESRGNLVRIYGEKHFLDISDVSTLPAKMVKVMKNIMLS